MDSPVGQGIATTFPVQTQEAWLRGYPEADIGMCLGIRVTPEHRLGAVDVDRDPFVRVTRVLLGGSPCVKKGMKGATEFVLVPTASSIKSCNLNDHEGRQVINLLVGGKMTVMPPTPHEKTGQPYVWLTPSILKLIWFISLFWISASLLC
jgi:hypothetical protein